MTRITLNIETEDLAVIERVSQALRTAGAPTPVRVEEPKEPVQEETPEPAGPSTTAVDNQHASEQRAADGPELDADGLPWDERIHASTKTKKQDGKWKAKRGVNAETVKQVEAELRSIMSAQPADEPEHGGYAEPNAAQAFGNDAPPPVEPPSQTPPPVEPPQAEQPTGDDTPADFMALVGAVGTNGITQDRIQSALAGMNPPLPSFAALGQRPDLIPAFWAKVNEG